MQWESIATGCRDDYEIHIDAARTIKRPRNIGLSSDLLAQGRWLRTLWRCWPDGVAQHFPKVHRLPTRSDNSLVLETVTGKNARLEILNGRLSAFETVAPAIRFALAVLPKLESSNETEPARRWYSDRFMTRLKVAEALGVASPYVFKAETVELAGSQVRNWLFAQGEDLLGVIANLHVPRVGLLHGDLHLGNILIGGGNDEFHFVDPRGGFGNSLLGDVAYDVAKLLHEPHYVAVRSGLVRCRTKFKAGTWSLTPAGRHLRSVAYFRLAIFAIKSAAIACQLLSDDADLAARATFVAGLHFLALTDSRFLSGGQRMAFLYHGLLWTLLGERLLSRQADFAECMDTWQRLLLTERPTEPAHRGQALECRT